VLPPVAFKTPIFQGNGAIPKLISRTKSQAHKYRFCAFVNVLL